MGNIMVPSGASLFDAIAGGDADAAVQLLRSHPGLTRKRLGTKKRTLYHFCAANGQLAVLKALCEHVRNMPPVGEGDGGDDVIVVGGNKRRAADAAWPQPNDGFHAVVLPAAAANSGRRQQQQHPDILRYINACDQKGLTPLSLACKKGHAHVVAYLLTQGADPWVRDRLMGRTALHHAARANHPDCIHAVLSSPAVAREEGGRTSSSPHKRGVQGGGGLATFSRKLADQASSSGYTPLHYAAAAHSRDAATALLRHGADPNAKTVEVGFEPVQLDRGGTPLHAAARYQAVDVAVLLLRHWDEHLRPLDMTDPRVVENLPRVKPYQLPGVKLNKTLLRVLDPATPIRDIVGCCGDDGGGAGGVSEAPYKHAAATTAFNASSPFAKQRSSIGFNRQDSGSSRLSGSGGSGGVEGAGPGPDPGPGDHPGIASPPPPADRSSPSAGPARRRAMSGAALQAWGGGARGAAAEPALACGGRSDGRGRPPLALALDRSGRGSFLTGTADDGAPPPPGPTFPTCAANYAATAPPPPPPPPPPGHVGRSRSGAVAPMPPPAGGSPGPVAPPLQRTLPPHQQDAVGVGSPTIRSSFSPESGSDRYREYGPYTEWASPACSSRVMEERRRCDEVPTAAAISGGATVSSGPSFFDAPAPASSRMPYARSQYNGTLDVLSQSARDGAMYYRPAPPVVAANEGTAKILALAQGQEKGVLCKSLSSSSSSFGGRRLAQTLSRKFSAAAGSLSTVRHDAVRACSPGREQQDTAECSGGGGDAGGAATRPAARGTWGRAWKQGFGAVKPAAAAAATAGADGAGAGGRCGGDGGGGMVPMAAVRHAF